MLIRFRKALTSNKPTGSKYRCTAAVYSDPRLIVDFKGQYRINRRAELYLEVMNLTNEFAQTFVREGGLKYNAQKQGTLYAAGVKLTY